MDERFINIEVSQPNVGDEVILLLDYTKYGRGKSAVMGYVHWTDTRQGYGGPRSLTGSGYLSGMYFSIPSIVAPGIATHWMPKPLVVDVDDDLPIFEHDDPIIKEDFKIDMDPIVFLTIVLLMLIAGIMTSVHQYVDAIITLVVITMLQAIRYYNLRKKTDGKN